jgi:hypothetical protein
MTTEELEAIARRLTDESLMHPADFCECQGFRGRVTILHPRCNCLQREILQALKDVRRETLEEAAAIAENADSADMEGQFAGGKIHLCVEAIRARLDQERPQWWSNWVT